MILLAFYVCGTCPLTLRQTEQRAHKKIFGFSRDELTGGYRRLHKDETCEVYFSQNIVWVTKYRSKKWVEHVARKWKINVDKMFYCAKQKKEILKYVYEPKRCTEFL